MIIGRGSVIISRLFMLFAIYLPPQGSVAVQTIPGAAGAADVITLVPGLLEGATKTNLTGTFSYDGYASPIELTSGIRVAANPWSSDYSAPLPWTR